jgi:DNA-binding transcriptional regulator LsrR (DeoR family)
LARFEFKFEIVSFVLPLPLFRSKNRVCLSHGVQVVGAAWRAVMRIVVGVGDLVQMTENSRTGQVLGGRAIERSDGAVCRLHHAREDKERRFLG